MKKILFIVAILFVLQSWAAPKPSFDERCKKVSDTWSAFWDMTGISNNMYFDPELYEVAYVNTELEGLKSAYKDFKKALSDFSKDERNADVPEFFKSLLRDAIVNRNINGVLSFAHLYIRTLPDDCVKEKMAIYTSILLPEYSRRHELNDIYYLYKTLEPENSMSEENRTLIINTKQLFLDEYKRLKETMPRHEALKGMWVSSSVGKHKLPRFILNVIEVDSSYYGIMNKNSPFLKEKKIKSSLAAPFRIDSAYNIELHYSHIERKEGMSEFGIQMLQLVISSISQSSVKTLYKHSNLSTTSKDLISTGISTASTQLIGTVANASENQITNRYMRLKLMPTDNNNIIAGACVVDTDSFTSSQSSYPIQSTSDEYMYFYKVYPDDEIVFLNDNWMPIVPFCRSINLYAFQPAVYKKFTPSRKKSIVAVSFMDKATTAPHNKEMQQKLSVLYDDKSNQ